MSSVTDVINEWLSGGQPAVIFDFNGTLSNDEHILFEIFSELFQAHLGWTMTADDYRRELLGRSDREIIQRATELHGRDDDVTQLMRLRKAAHKEYVAREHPIDEATVQLVNTLADNEIPMAIVTGAQRDDVLAVLQSSPVEAAFVALVAEEDVAEGKPHPEGFLTGARLLDRRPQDVLVFEDSVPGVHGALAAGMRCIAVGTDPSSELVAAAPAIAARLTTELLPDSLVRRPGASPPLSAGPRPST
jgi:HAD superfamily hydrolase (TIGR01509 family)